MFSALVWLLGAYDKNAETPDYLEATVFNKNEAVIMVGNFADVKNSSPEAKKINHVTKWYKPWFYKHVETFLQNEEGKNIKFDFWQY